MLTSQENAELTQVGPGTLMGDLMRCYWIPFYLSADLEADGAPARVRLLGEDLVVYRDTRGDVGLLEEQCPHRGASLFFARNEDCGLRCAYHGWKFDVTGACLDMPNEPPENNFKSKIRQRAYSCRERNGVVWTYMGSLDPAPPLPNVEWNCVPESRAFLPPPRVQETNFMQAVEGEFDSTHVPILHGRLTDYMGDEARARGDVPYFYTREAPYGVLIGARYRKSDNTSYWRIYPFEMPFYTPINVHPMYERETMFSGHAFIPMDDENTLAFGFTWHPTRDLTAKERADMTAGFPGGYEGLHPAEASFLPAHDGPYGKYWPKLNHTNNWGFDYRRQQRNELSCGVPGLWPQDVAVQRGFGPIANRTKEHLGAADAGQIAMRRRLLNAARVLRDDGIQPPGATEPAVYAARPTQTILSDDVADQWYEVIEPVLVGPYQGA